MPKHQNFLRQFQPSITTTHSTTPRQLSYSRFLNCQLSRASKQTSPNPSQNQSVLRSDWNNLIPTQSANRKDDMLRVLKGTNYVLQVLGQKRNVTPRESMGGNVRYGSQYNSRDKLLKTLCKKNMHLKNLRQTLMHSRRQREQSQKKYLSKNCRLKKIVDNAELRVL